MEVEPEILELKFEGNGVNPDSVRPQEIAELIISFEKALLATIKQNNPEIDTNFLFFTFKEIKNESIGLRFVPAGNTKSLHNASTENSINVPKIVLSSFLLLSTSLKDGDFNRLNKETISNLKTITKFSKKYDCKGSFKYNNEVISSFSPNTEITIDKTKLIKENTTIYGKLIDIGGENPNVHIKISDDQTLIFKATEKNAKKLASKLYEQVGVQGVAKFNPNTLEIVEFKLESIIEYTPGNTLKAIRELRSITSGFWDKFKTNEEINDQLLRD